jgi:hypothetical protein
MDRIEPFKMTAEEEADWLTWRRKNKECASADSYKL